MKELYIEFINFFKKHNLYDEKAFNYLRENSIFFDYLEEEKRPYIGYHYLRDKNGILREIQLCVPYINNYKTLLINIHEYTHGLSLYKQLGKKFELKEDSETLPMLYEKIYLLENPNEDLQNFLNYLNNLITENSPARYRIALALQNELLEYYQNKKPSFEKLEQKTQKLVKQYQSK